MKGARAKHKIDVWIRFNRFGIEARWVVDCKFWRKPVTKEKVLALMSVVDDVGAEEAREFLRREAERVQREREEREAAQQREREAVPDCRAQVLALLCNNLPCCRSAPLAICLSPRT